MGAKTEIIWASQYLIPRCQNISRHSSFWSRADHHCHESRHKNNESYKHANALLKDAPFAVVPEPGPRPLLLSGAGGC